MNITKRKEENKIHLFAYHGWGLCGTRTHRIANHFSEVTCEKCMRTEEYGKYLEGKFREKPPTFEEDCASGYYQTGRRMPWLQEIVDAFDPIKAKELADIWNRRLSEVWDGEVEIKGEELLEFVKNIWALLAINKETVEVLRWLETAMDKNSSIWAATQQTKEDKGEQK